jgi:hypothetical protein
MKKGDHLRVFRGYYCHHGIYVGDDQVIHYGRGLADLANAKVEMVSTRVFSNNSPIEILDSASNFSADEIVARAKSRLGESSYDLFQNNCEHFVSWCRTAESHSNQIATTETIARQSAAAAVKPAMKRLLANRIAKASTGVVAIKLASRTTGVAILGDATQAVAELTAMSLGQSKQDARVIGLGAGAATSVVAGLAIGGPVGGAASLGIWLTAQLIADQAVAQSKRIFNGIVAPST